MRPFSLLCFLISTYALGPLEASPGESPLEIDDPVYRWGTAYKGRRIEHTYRLRNRGTAPLTVREIRSDCGCTVVGEEIRNRTLKPGEVLEVTLALETGSLKPGSVRKSAEIVAEPELEEKTLWMEGEIVELFSTNPAELALDVVRDPALAARTRLEVRFTNRFGFPAVVRKVRARGGLAEVKLREEKPGRKYVIELAPRLDLSNRTALHTETIEAVVDAGADRLELAFPLRLVLKDRIAVLPAKSVWFGPTETRNLGRDGGVRPLRKTLTVESLGGPDHRFRIRKVQCEGGRVRVSVETEEDGRKYKLHVDLPPPGENPPPLLRDKVVIETDDPEVPQLFVPVLARF